MEKKVVFILETLSSGGAERAVSNVSQNLSNNIKQEIILLGDKAKITYNHNSKIIFLDRYKHIGTINKIIILLKRINKLKSKKKKDHAVFISFMEYPNLLNLLTNKYSTNYISVRNHMSSKYKKGLKSFLWNYSIKRLYSNADKVIAVSNEIKKDLVDNYQIEQNKVEVIYNSYPVEEIQQQSTLPVEKPYKTLFDKPTITTMGSLTNQKAQWHLIRSFSEVVKKIPDAQLLLLGEGKLESYLKELTIEYNIENNVHFLGFQENPFKFIARSDVFVFPSLYEGFPNALAEAMATGVPIIASDCLSGPREILAPEESDKKYIEYGIKENRYGILTKVPDETKYSAKNPITNEEFELASYIGEILLNEELKNYFKEQSKKRIKDFHINKIIKQWEKIVY